MSLHIYFEGVDDLSSAPVEYDMELLFKTIKLDGCAYDRAIIRCIELGEYFDSIKFTDRFGAQLFLEYLSTGAKAALSLHHRPDVVIWCGEVGNNALTQIVRNCVSGGIVLNADCQFVHRDVVDVSIDVECHGVHYSSLDELAQYLMEDAPQ